MKRTKPLPPQDADRLNREIMKANEADRLFPEWQSMMFDVLGREWAKNLPTLSRMALVDYLHGISEGELLHQGLPECELNQFEKLAYKTRKTAERIIRLGGGSEMTELHCTMRDDLLEVM